MDITHFRGVRRYTPYTTPPPPLPWLRACTCDHNGSKIHVKFSKMHINMYEPDDTVTLNMLNICMTLLICETTIAHSIANSELTDCSLCQWLSPMLAHIHKQHDHCHHNHQNNHREKDSSHITSTQSLSTNIQSSLG